MEKEKIAKIRDLIKIIIKAKHKNEQRDKYIKPNKKELSFLNLAYNKFYDLHDKLTKKENILNSQERFLILKNIFQIYNECLQYEPIRYYLKFLEKNRPSGDIESLKYFQIIRHILIHFPFFEKWNDVYITHDLITWTGKKSKIDSFLLDNEGKEPFKWRIWDPLNKKMKYGYVINFPKDYSKNSKIYLKDLIDENYGIEISLIMIKGVLESQVESKR